MSSGYAPATGMGGSPGAGTGDSSGAGAAGSTGSPRLTGRRRPRLTWWAVPTAIVVVLIAVAVAVGGGGGGSDLARDPANPGPRGARALAEVLSSHGVVVTVARSRADLAHAGIGRDTTVLVSTPDRLSPTLSADLRRAATGAAKLVVLAPNQTVVTALTPAVSSRPARPPADSLVANCGTGALTAGDRLSRADREYATAPAVGERCFADPTEPRWSVYLSVPGSSTAPPVVYLGASGAATNAELADSDNAGVLIRLLGASDHLVWYVPDPAEAALADGTPATEYFPRWTGSVLGLLVLTVLALMFTRGRRFGRLVTEPLPVVVRAIETTQARGRIYLRAKDFERSALLLQQAGARRLARAAALPTSPAPSLDVVADSVAARTGRPPSEVHSILTAPARTEQDMLVIAAALAALEKEMRQR